jgi:hypothetical protein
VSFTHFGSPALHTVYGKVLDSALVATRHVLNECIYKPCSTRFICKTRTRTTTNRQAALDVPEKLQQHT